MNERFLRARILLPITAPPVEDGAVLVSSGQVVAAGRWADLRKRASAPVTDLGEVILLPGLINAHCHLDYTRLAGCLPPPRSFSAWIQGVLALKAGWSYSDYAASWLDGAEQLRKSGCTTVVDFEAVPELLPDVWNASPLRVLSVLELTGIRGPKSPSELVADATRALDMLRHPRSRGGLGPHAPYSTRPELWRACAEAARAHGWLLSMHVAESDEEFHMFRHANGPMHRWLGPQRGAGDCGTLSPIRRVLDSGVATTSSLLVHVNYLDDGDETALAASGAWVVHCPRSHDYFGHDRFPLERLRAAGVEVCLGTDSLLSVRKAGRNLPVLDLRREMAAFQAVHPAWSAERVLALATAIPGRFLARWIGGPAGTLEPGAPADLAAFGYQGAAADAPEAIVHGEDDAIATWVAGDRSGPPSSDAPEQVTTGREQP